MNREIVQQHEHGILQTSSCADTQAKFEISTPKLNRSKSSIEFSKQ